VFRQERHKSAPRPQPVAKTLMHVCGYVAVRLRGCVAVWLAVWLAGCLAVVVDLLHRMCTHMPSNVGMCVDMRGTHAWTCRATCGHARGHAGICVDMRVTPATSTAT
jgi:hypothetical protein